MNFKYVDFRQNKSKTTQTSKMALGGDTSSNLPTKEKIDEFLEKSVAI